MKLKQIKLTSFFKPIQAKIQCPLCNDMFTCEHTEFHAATCGQKFSIILTDDEDDNDITMPYQQESSSIEVAKNQINITELFKDIKHHHTCNGEIKYKIEEAVHLKILQLRFKNFGYHHVS